jgi:hypothetical protein
MTQTNTDSSGVERVRAYYAGFGQRGWDRLDNPADGVIERELTQRALTRHLRGNERTGRGNIGSQCGPFDFAGPSSMVSSLRARTGRSSAPGR